MGEGRREKQENKITLEDNIKWLQRASFWVEVVYSPGTFDTPRYLLNYPLCTVMYDIFDFFVKDDIYLLKFN